MGTSADNHGSAGEYASVSTSIGLAPLRCAWCQVRNDLGMGRVGHTPASHRSQGRRVPAKRHVVEFRVTPDAVIPLGTELFAAHFVPGQKVDVAGTSKGKGFSGVMKRYNFR